MKADIVKIRVDDNLGTTPKMAPEIYKAVIDGMSSHRVAFGMVAGLVVGYATARFAGVLSDNLRNALFEKVGQRAARLFHGVQLWGNLPQTYSMVGLIVSAMRLSRSWEEAFWRG